MELSITSVFILTSLLIFSNILLTIRLLNNYDLKTDIESITHNENRKERILEIQEVGCPEPIKNDVWPNDTNSLLKHFNLNISRWDSRRMFRLYDNIIIGEKYLTLSDYYNVTLATQSSLERLSSLVQVARLWTGPISVGVYAAGTEEFQLLLQYIQYLKTCFHEIREQVTFHLAIPQEGQPSTTAYDGYNQDCTRPDRVLKQLLLGRNPQTIKWRIRNPYPQNLMRNLARKACQTSFVFLTDVDILPNENMADGLRVFLKSNLMCLSGKCAYVIPTFELDERVNFPKDKTDLLRLIKKGLARPFHEKVLIYNQFATNISRWKEHHDIMNQNGKIDVHISHTVTNYEFLYEPFYVALDTVPEHNERFIGYGFTRNTQVYEMFMAGYTFYVLSPIFTCHWGLQLKKTRPHWRERQNTMNGRQFEMFKREMFAKYNKDPLNMMKTQLKGSKKSH